MPCSSIFAVSIAVAQKSPIFWASLPWAALVAADCSLICRRLTYSCSRTSLPIPQAASDAGIGCLFNQPPLKRHPIPASEAAWGIGNEVREQLYVNLRQINEQSAATKAAQGSDAQKIGDFWATAMDTAKINEQGIHPLDAELARIDAIRTPGDAMDVAFAEGPLQVGPFFSFYVYQDERRSDVQAVHLSQGGLGLPARDLYFN